MSYCVNCGVELGATALYAGYSAFKACKKYLAK